MTEAILLAAILLVTIVGHELGHLAAALWYGWSFVGVQVRWWGGGIAAVTDDLGDLWKVALAGPAASALIAAWCWALEPLHPVFWIGFWLNIAAVAINLLPIPVADGGHLVRAFRAAREGA